MCLLSLLGIQIFDAKSLEIEKMELRLKIEYCYKECDCKIEAITTWLG